MTVNEQDLETARKSCCRPVDQSPRCDKCGLRKAPIGRSVPAETSNSYCYRDQCDDYEKFPWPICYWHGEEEPPIYEKIRATLRESHASQIKEIVGALESFLIADATGSRTDSAEAYERLLKITGLEAYSQEFRSKEGL